MSRNTVLLVELFMMKQKLERTDVCCRIRWSHREQTSFCERQVSSSLQKSPKERWTLPWSTLSDPFLEIANVTCSFPAGLEDLRLQEAATAQPCGRREERYLHVHGHIEWIKIFTHPKFSFWLRVAQVSGKQAIFPRIPTQISYRNEQRSINPKPVWLQYILLTETHRETWTAWSRYHPDKDIRSFKLLQKTSHILQNSWNQMRKHEKLKGNSHTHTFLN